MTPTDFADLLTMLKRDEGTGPAHDGRFFPYTDSAGKITVGWGHNLSDQGLKGKFAQMLLEDDATDHIAALSQAFPIVLTLTHARQIALSNMAFNLGVPVLHEFHNLWAAIGAGDFETAALEMVNSKWAAQVGARATRLSEMMRRGDTV